MRSLRSIIAWLEKPGRLLLLSGAAVALAACGGAPPRDEAGESPAQEEWQVDLLIGDVEGPDEYVFGRIGGLAADAQGRLFVADHQASEIRVFDADGRFLFAFARRGAGPGEVEGPCCLAFSPDGRLWVRDKGNARYNAYLVGEREARFESSLLIQHAAANLWAPLTFDAAGRLVDVGMRAAPGGGEFELLRLHLEGRAAAADTEVIASPPAAQIGMFTLDVTRGGMQGRLYLYQPYGPRHLVAHAPGAGWAEAVSSHYRIRWHSAAGSELVIERPDRLGPELSAAEREQADSQIADDAKRLGLSRRDLPFDVPERKPPLRELFFDLRGRLWVELSVAQGSSRKAEVYGPDGQLAALYAWPQEVRLNLPGYVGEDLALGITEDSLGTQKVARLRLTRGRR
jgi:hypothetical protein